jgi:hypothetical protein
MDAMPVVLTQHFSPLDRVYQDAEFSLYHYPRVYFTRVEPYDRFIYYRPLGKSARRPDSRRYFGHGVIGQPFPDPYRADHRFAPLVRAKPFPRLVGDRDIAGNFYETESSTMPPFQAAVRRISETAYHRILAEAGVTAASIEAMPSTEAVSAFYLPSATTQPPRDHFRIIKQVPPGAGYVPHNTELNVYESAALRERARADHQRVLSLIADRVHERGGTCSYNNNVDLLADFGNTRVLVEAKSLTDLRDGVDRMRYGIGQLADYGFRYRSELSGAAPLLAFGHAPDRQTEWIADVLQDNGVGFAAMANDGLVALNAAGRELPLFRV